MTRRSLGYTSMTAFLIYTVVSITGTSLEEHSSKFNIQDTSLEQHLSECILDIVEIYFNPDFPFTVQTPGTWVMASPDIASHLRHTNGNGDILLKMLNRDYFIPYITLGYPYYYEIPLHKRDKPSSHLILVSGKNRLSTIYIAVHMINRVHYHTRNDAARTIIALIDPIQTYKERILLAKAILKMAWQVSLLTNVIIITIVVEQDVYYFDIFGWTPENKQNKICKMEIEAVIYLGQYTSNYERIILANLFPSKQLRDMKDCVLEVDIFPNFPYFMIANNRLHGIYITLLKIAAEIMNFKMKLNINQNSHTSIMVVPVLYHEYEECSFTYPYITSELAWFVPSGKYITFWQCMFKVFNSTTWLLIGLTFISGTLTFWLLGILSNLKRVHMETRLTVIFLHSILIHLGMGVPDRYHGPTAVILFMLWLGYCLQIYTLYQSSFIGHIVNPEELPHFKTKTELLQSNLQMFSLVSVFYHNITFNEHPLCQDQDFDCFRRLADKKDIAVLSSRHYGELCIRSVYSRSGKPEFVALEEKFESTYFSIFILGIGCMLHNELDSIQERLFQSGILTRWLDITYHEVAKTYNKNLNIQGVIAFKISHLQGPFFLLIIGLLIGFIVFCVELLFNYYVFMWRLRKSWLRNKT